MIKGQVMSQSTFLKTFEYCLKNKIENLIPLNERQHGFRKLYSTVTACLTVKETINCYLKNNSKVYLYLFLRPIKSI